MAAKSWESKFKIRYDWFKITYDWVTSKSQTAGVISSRMRKIDDYHTQLSECYESILSSVEDATTLKRYEDLYEEATLFYNKLEAVSSAYPNLDGSHVPTESSAHTRLPTIELIKFYGDEFSWNSFFSLYTSLILCRKDISKTEKFHFLFSKLENEPRSLVQHLPMVDSSLDTAMEILKSRYENKRLLADAHLARILNLPALSRSNGLRTQVLNPLLESCRALENLNLPIKEWSYILLHIVLGKLPQDVRSRFEQAYGRNCNILPTLDELTGYLQAECRSLDTYVSRQDTHSEQRRPARVHIINDFSGKRTVLKCLYCSIDGHNMDRCFRFKNLSNLDRKNWISSHKLCYKCFGEHTANYCQLNQCCVSCGNNGHNSLICLRQDASTSSTKDTGRYVTTQHVLPLDNTCVNQRPSMCDGQMHDVENSPTNSNCYYSSQ